jgi:hypothetical protein
MRENGYLLLGKSQFRATQVDEKLSLDQAKKIGAEVVMVHKQFVSRETESVPIAEWMPGQRTDQTDLTVVHQGDKAPKVIVHTTTTEVQGEFKTSYVEQGVDYYDYSATFWARLKPPVFGVNVKELDQAAKDAIGSNKGVQVRIVVKGSPAYDADLLRDDIILRLDGEDVTDPDQFFALVEKHRGKTVPVDIYRSGRLLTIDVAVKQ